MNIQFQTQDIEALQRVLEKGCKWVRFTATAQDKPLVEKAVSLCRKHEAVLIIDEDAALCEAVKADGIHLKDHQQTGSVRRALGEEPLIGADCTSLAEARTARAGGADYIDAGPFEKTSAEALRQLVLSLYEADIPLPVCISGQTTPDDLPTIAATGVRGILTADETFFRKDIWALIDKLS